ncbi:hypothetical protein C1637_21100 [Chryseobacterium lactis]|uniref:DUF3828 domain-containing protein n=1 Tax=Chryseobacterium lactis TaxID=1241981 RepID=A0A3G6RGA2_CHRLC|nr:hypothetical protein [Chryseobacterium lactis]AZA83431.1 hypothetical protein EG342_16760 [Chryseobacterium lactis]AZB03815.1 hypothetical protein EG341_07635 [Chryseobacterium lactis]PNW11608.1 hypothetical protein C1637_21100 [Chryseobacterium lactis]
MIKKLILISATLPLFIHCKKDDTKKQLQQDNPRKHDGISLSKKQDEFQIETVKKFLSWYRDNENHIYSFNTVKGGSQGENEVPANYYIDFNQVEKELEFLKNSGFFSEKFLADYKNRYTEGNEYFRQNPANDGPPVNFDYNYFFLTQEDYESDLKNIDGIKFDVKSVTAKLCYVEFYLKNCGMTLRYTLTKREQWQIDSIENISK